MLEMEKIKNLVQILYTHNTISGKSEAKRTQKIILGV
jgi:hypothetical protein